MDTKKLRQKILDLAIHGKLVPQNPNDEPASVLLERIRAEKERLVKEGKIKKSKKTDKSSDTPHYENRQVGEANVPFEVPGSWEWTNVGNVGDIVTGNTPSKDFPEYYGGDIPFYKPTDLEQGKCVKKASDYLSLLGFEQARKLPAKSVLITCIGATIGKTGLITIEGSCNQQINAIISHNFALAEFVYYVCTSDYFQNEIKFNASATTLPILNKGNFAKLLFPLPPLAEQERIVTEIERWFTLIDQIEQGKADLQTTIKQTKSKILDLAIHGKLVPQDPNDEPASELLKRINPKAEITCDNGLYGKVLFEVPISWKWCSLKDCCHIVGRIGFRGYTKDDLVTDGNGAITLSPSNIINGTMNYDKCTFISWHKYEESPEIQVLCGDILLVKTGSSFGKCALVEHLPKEATINPQFVVLKHISIDKQYLTYVLKSDYARNNYDNFVLGTAIPTFTQVVLGNMQIPLPPLEEQHRIVAKIEELFTSLDRIQKALEV